MATWVGHGILGYAVARGAGVGRWPALGYAALASAPDLDLLVGLAVQGDLSAFHRAWWSHSPTVVAFGVAAAYVISTSVAVARGKRPHWPAIHRTSLIVGMVLATHLVADYLVVNPVVQVPHPPSDELLRALGRELMQLATDALLYGALVFGAWWLLRWIRARRSRRRATAS